MERESLLVKTTDNPPIRISVSKIDNSITFKIQTGHYLELLTLETMKLPGSTKNKITKNKTYENVPRLEITEAALAMKRGSFSRMLL